MDERQETPNGAAHRAPLRRDAERNRERIIAAACQLYAEHGLGVGFNEVAHRAGVGVGTVYRRFADRRELLQAALAEPLQELYAVARAAAATPRAWDGLTLLVTGVTDLLVENIGLRDAALGGYEDLVPQVTGGIPELLDGLFERAREQGDVREGVDGHDVLVMLWMVTELAKHAADVRPDAYRRYTTALLDGLRASSSRAPLPDPLHDDEVAAISRRWADASSRARTP
ncbi:TetR/AcrR family transcriptional regulator [Cellulomonas palmilytica]|uniref:TetR/AcrR family transcriptional regulator n=1 Tax=Cellulomonas palmilytica TaxID=2608402 RepID=UPI001F2F66C1|nr:helix-turn-helix domain-containing protein [Cellulomonas palmilytica]UJP39631.1 helix-turn-helix transcriptional regulator [Cellulomonas palmilytica]